MREQKYHIYLDSHEKTTLLQSLVELKINSFSKADIQTVLTSLSSKS